jgi:predicted dehydrogenase
MKKDPVKFAILGCGHIGKRHAEMVRRNPESELVAMCDVVSGEQAGVTGYGVPYFNSVRALFSSGPDFDVVSVCTPNGLHAEHALLALQHGRHVLLEKPMALTKADCERIISKSLQVNKNVFCVMQNRYSPPSAWLRHIVKEDILGDIFMVNLNCFWNRDERYYLASDWKGTAELDGGTLFTQFSHFIDILYWVFGDITDIQAKFSDFTHAQSTAFEDSGLVTFRFLNGGMGSLSYSTSVWDKNMESSISVIGEKGAVKIGGQYMNEVTYCHIRDYVMPALDPVGPANDYGAYKGSAANHHFIIENVIGTLKGRTSMTTNALEGMKVVEIIERIYTLNTIKKRNPAGNVSGYHK